MSDSISRIEYRSGGLLKGMTADNNGVIQQAIAGRVVALVVQADGNEPFGAQHAGLQGLDLQSPDELQVAGVGPSNDPTPPRG